MNKEEIVLDTDPDIVKWKTNIEGWVGKDGRFYGNDKRQAIYNNSTHKKCEKGHIYRRHWSSCPECREAELPEKYLQMPYKEWDGKTVLYLYDSTDKYFRNEDEVRDYLEEIIEEGGSKEDIRLVICEPLYLPQVEEDYFEEVLPEDWELSDVSKEVSEKLASLNEAIRKCRPASWLGGKYRTTLNLD